MNPEISNANDLRGYHFKRLMQKPATLLGGGIFAFLAGGVGAAAVGPVIGIVALLAAVLLVALIVFAIADSKAEDAFFQDYAQEHSFELQGKHSLPQSTPLLGKGDDRYANRTLSGNLAEDCEGTLALFTYEDETTDSNGNRQTNYYRYTLTLTEVPEAVEKAPKLRVQRKFGFRALQGMEDAFRKDERVELESEALAKHYEIFAGKECDSVWLRQLFSPQFIVWMTEAAPEKFAFEFYGGTLCCFVNGHKEDAVALDTMRAAGAAVHRQLRKEAAESAQASES